MNSKLDHLFSLLANSTGQNYIGEKISQLEHALQSADRGRLYSPDPQIAIACLFHDVGHLIEFPEEVMDSWGVMDHEVISSKLILEAGLPSEIAALIESHVIAKRYLVSTNPLYKKNLSLASQKTLEFQGGEMNALEIHEFESDPLFEKKLLIRRCDDEAKIVNHPTASLDFYKNYVEYFLRSQRLELT